MLGDQAYLAAIPLAERQALALISMLTYGKAYNISLVFFGFYLVQLGYLTWRSTFLPRWLGVLVATGIGWAVFLYPPLAQATSRYVVLCSLGEIILVFWLGLKGVDEQRWREAEVASRA